MAETEKTILSACGRYSVDIVRRPTGGFQLLVYQWTEEWAPHYGKLGEFWEPVSRTATFTDTLERAEELAEEKFRLFGTTGPVARDE